MPASPERRPMTRRDVTGAFPAVESIRDDDLRDRVIDAWVDALAETGWDVDDAPWYPPEQARLGLPDETLVDHVNEVVDASVALAEVLVDHRGDRLDVDVDLVLAGALIHDISKLYEFDADGATDVEHFFGHPHYGVYPAARAGLPPEVVHVTLSHTALTGVEPATIEAEIVRRADQTVASAIRAGAVDDLREA
jgi:putative nucleotidyltransferase with HDIG domain